ncbi:Structural maintenance of chromosomes protein 6B [Bienertia sinuspersici]
MENSEIPNTQPHRTTTAGTIRCIKLENFMCHSNLVIELGDYVNFITGQNGSGKSAILTALCVAFGSRAKATNRAATLKDFIKTGCSYASVQVVLKNEGADAFKPELYGESIIIERRITESSSSLVLKDHHGKRVSNKKEEVRELVEHFNVDVENPCVIMSQDKSREFLQSGNAKDKFKFFFKATLLQQVDDLLHSIEQHLEIANELVQELERSIEPVVRELNELQEKIKNTEHVEELSERVKQMKFKLAWSWVYNVDKEVLKQSTVVEKMKSRLPACQAEVDLRLEKIEGLRKIYAEMRSRYEHMMQKASEVNTLKDELDKNLSAATMHMRQLEQEYDRKMGDIQKMMKHVASLKRQVHDIEEQTLQNTQAEETEMQEKLKVLQDELDAANALLASVKEEETLLAESFSSRKDEVRKLGDQTLTQGNVWACAVENAIGRVLNAFIVTSVKDSHILRSCAREVHYDHLQIIIYKFSVPRYNILHNQLPQTRHPTTLSVLHSDSDTVMNVLVDKGSAERQVLVKDYDTGKTVAFGERVPNLKEVYTAEGYRMFSRGSVQTILPPNKRARTGRLCSSFDDQIKDLEKDALFVREQFQNARQQKRAAEDEVRVLHEKLQSIKRRCHAAVRDSTSKKLAFDSLKCTYAAEAGGLNSSSVDELCEEISRVQANIQEKETLLEGLQVQINDSKIKVSNLKASLGNLHESANEDLVALSKAEKEFEDIAKELDELKMEKLHYERVLKEKTLPDIQEAEAKYQQLEQKRKDYYEKASYMCPENEVEAMGGFKESTPEQLSAQLTRMNERLERARDKYTESIDDLRNLYEKKQRKILTKQKTYGNFRNQLQDAKRALQSRRQKFDRSATLMKRQLTWKFNANLAKKGISGQIKVDYKEKTLSIEVKMPQDASSTAVRDTRGLSGGERSFSTLCFALALHQMTESPFRAMDEFDVFMDAVSRKISLDTLVDFALAHGSQWIFITPHDISMVKQDERVKKQQMAAPRS